MKKIISIDAHNPATILIQKATDIIRTGGILAYPTETFYGLAADPTNDAALARIFDIKGRSFNNPIALIIAHRADLKGLAQYVPEEAEKLMSKFWPGPLTLLFNARANVSTKLTAGTGKIGARISSHPIAHALTRGLGRPITATSANLSGGHECTTAQQVISQIGAAIDLIIDSGATPGGKGSTILDVTKTPPLIIREGFFSKHTVYG